MSAIIAKSVKKTPINKSIFMTQKVKNYTDEEKSAILLRFSHPAIFGKGKVLGDIISPLCKEVDE